MPKVRLFHGTATAFDKFDDKYTMRGSEPNSALGIHLTESPWLASAYAELAADSARGQPIVLAVDVDVDRVAVVSSREQFLGREDGLPLEFCERNWSEYISARLTLQENGLQGIAGDELGDDLIGAWVIFDPDRIEIVERIPASAAKEMDHDPIVLGVEFVPVDLFEDDPEEVLAL